MTQTLTVQSFHGNISQKLKSAIQYFIFYNNVDMCREELYTFANNVIYILELYKGSKLIYHILFLGRFLITIKCIFHIYMCHVQATFF